MRTLGKLFRRSSREKSVPAEEVPCPHVALAQRWDRAEDIGYEERASSYVCQACGQSFTASEVRELRRSEPERVAEAVACPHPALVREQPTEESGGEPSGYTCEVCGQPFSPDEAQSILEAAKGEVTGGPSS